MSRSQEVCGKVFNDGVICTLHKGHHACAVGMHFSAGPEYAPSWWKHRWSQTRPMIMMRQHWVIGWCTWCSTRFAAPTYMQLYKAFHALRCPNRQGDVHKVIAGQDIPPIVAIDYTNWKGERATRRIHPHAVRHTSNDYHREPQWLLDARDLDKDVKRTFAMKDIHSWKEEGTT